MIHKTLVVGPLQCNCAILACERTKEAVIIDPGDEAERIAKEVTAEGFKVKYLLHTHAHFDHIGGTGGVKSSLGGTICLHRGDIDIYRNLPMQGQLFGFKFSAAPEVEKFIEDNEEIVFGDHRLEAIHTPGHSPGGLCFRSRGGDELLFSGDSLFQQSIGRTDLWGGNHGQLLNSIRERIFTLEGDTKVFPGHGPATKVGVEKMSNPFFN